MILSLQGLDDYKYSPYESLVGHPCRLGVATITLAGSIHSQIMLEEIYMWLSKLIYPAHQDLLPKSTCKWNALQINLIYHQCYLFTLPPATSLDDLIAFFSCSDDSSQASTAVNIFLSTSCYSLITIQLWALSAYWWSPPLRRYPAPWLGAHNDLAHSRPALTASPCWLLLDWNTDLYHCRRYMNRWLICQVIVWSTAWPIHIPHF